MSLECRESSLPPRACSGNATGLDADPEHDSGKRIKLIIFKAVTCTKVRNPKLIWGLSWETIEGWDDNKPQTSALFKLTQSAGFQKLLNDRDKDFIWRAYFARGGDSILTTNAAFAHDYVAALAALLKKIPENSLTELTLDYH